MNQSVVHYRGATPRPATYFSHLSASAARVCCLAVFRSGIGCYLLYLSSDMRPSRIMTAAPRSGGFYKYPFPVPVRNIHHSCIRCDWESTVSGVWHLLYPPLGPLSRPLRVMSLLLLPLSLLIPPPFIQSTRPSRTGHCCCHCHCD